MGLDDIRVFAAAADRPLPTPDEVSEPFWSAAREHQLVLQRCARCNRVRYYPTVRCPHCHGADAAWEPMSGAGTVYSYSVVHRALAPGFSERVPLVVVIVDLDEGVRMMSNVVGCDPDAVTIGMPVRVTWEDVDDAHTLPVFEPRG